MAVTAPVHATAAQSGGAQYPRPKWRPLESEGNLAFLLLLPTLALLGLFIAYPFVRGILLSVTSARVGVPGQWVGFDNYTRLLSDPIFHLAVKNTVWYTFVTTIFKLALGLWLAMLLNRDFKFKAFTRAFILLPFIIPTVLSTFAWKWMFDPTFSVINWTLFQLGFISQRINWLGDPSPKGLRQSHGLMVNYLYDLKRLDRHRRELAQGTVPVAGAVQSLLD